MVFPRLPWNARKMMAESWYLPDFHKPSLTQNVNYYAQSFIDEEKQSLKTAWPFLPVRSMVQEVRQI